MAGDVLIRPDTLIATDQLMRRVDCINEAHVAYLAIANGGLSDSTRMAAEPLIAAANQLSFVDPQEAAKMLSNTVRYCLQSLVNTRTDHLSLLSEPGKIRPQDWQRQV